VSKQLSVSDSPLRGRWVATTAGIKGDPVCERIGALVRTYLVAVGTSPDGWSDLLVDPDDGRYWELTYPESDLHGGGPPMLTALASDEAIDRYGVNRP
jgi:hypothetical protein